MSFKTYSKLIRFDTFEERFEYLRLDGDVGKETFGFDRYLNQLFYTSLEWRTLRREIIMRDRGCDLGMDGFEIHGQIIIHHMNPITTNDIVNRTDILLNPEYLISTCLSTHNSLHYGDISNIQIKPTERTAGDTCPWKRR